MFVYYIVGENSIGTTKTRNNYGAIQYSNIRLFSIAPCKVIAINLLCFFYGICSLLLFYIAHSKVIAHLTIAIAIVVALLALRGDSKKIIVTFCVLRA